MDIKEFLKKKKQFEKMISEQGKEMVSTLIEDFIEKQPNIRGIRWCQYTPYFNDGEACTFSVYGVYFSYDKEIPADDWDTHSEEGTSFKYASSKDEKAFEDTLEKIEDVLQSIFGDHVEVKVSIDENKKIRYVVEEHEHE